MCISSEDERERETERESREGRKRRERERIILSDIHGVFERARFLLAINDATDISTANDNYICDFNIYRVFFNAVFLLFTI